MLTIGGLYYLYIKWYNLSNSILFQNILASLGLLHFYINLRIILVSTKKDASIFIRMALNIHFTFGETGFTKNLTSFLFKERLSFKQADFLLCLPSCSSQKLILGINSVPSLLKNGLSRIQILKNISLHP